MFPLTGMASQDALSSDKAAIGWVFSATRDSEKTSVKPQATQGTSSSSSSSFFAQVWIGCPLPRKKLDRREL